MWNHLQILTTQPSYVFCSFPPHRLFKLAGSMVKQTDKLTFYLILEHHSGVADFYNIMSHKQLQTIATTNLSQQGLSHFVFFGNRFVSYTPTLKFRGWRWWTHEPVVPKAIKTQKRRRTWSVVIVTICLSIDVLCFQHICCQIDEDISLICSCFVYFYLFNEVTEHWALSAAILYSQFRTMKKKLYAFLNNIGMKKEKRNISYSCCWVHLTLHYLYNQ